MSSFNAIGRLNEVWIDVCPHFRANWPSGFLVAFDYYPIFLFVATFSISIYYSDIFLALLGFALSFDWFLNYALAQAFRQPPVTPGCGPEFEMPSFSSQHAVFFACSLWIFALLYNYRVSPPRAIGLTFLLGTVMYARLYIGIASPAQLLVGALVGVIESSLFMLFIHLAIYPRVRRILRWRFFRFMGYERGILGKAYYRCVRDVVSHGIEEDEKT